MIAVTLVEVYRDLELLHRLLVRASALAHAMDEAVLDAPGGWRHSEELHALSAMVDQAAERAGLLR